MQNSSPLASRFPAGTKYVLESKGPFVRRYIEFPNGRIVPLETRIAETCHCVARYQVSIIPDQNADRVEVFDRRYERTKLTV
jgi:hypothetical protein